LPTSRHPQMGSSRANGLNSKSLSTWCSSMPCRPSPEAAASFRTYLAHSNSATGTVLTKLVNGDDHDGTIQKGRHRAHRHMSSCANLKARPCMPTTIAAAHEPLARRAATGEAATSGATTLGAQPNAASNDDAEGPSAKPPQLQARRAAPEWSPCCCSPTCVPFFTFPVDVPQVRRRAHAIASASSLSSRWSPASSLSRRDSL